MTRIFFIALLAVSSHANGQSLIGKPVDNLEFRKILNSKKPTARLADFQSKVVILDFWATWCAPCITSLPHLETLQKRFINDIHVLTITDESEERITTFLQKKKLSLPVVIDEERKLNAVFPHRSIPHTIVIDKDGLVKAITTPEKLDETILQEIIAGKTPSLVEKSDNLNFDPSLPLANNENFTYQVTVTPYQRGFPSMSNTIESGSYKGRRIYCTNLSPKTLYEIAFQFPMSIRTIIAIEDKRAFEWNESNAICFDLIVPEEIGSKRFDIMKQHLDYLYNFKPVIEKRKRDVKILKRIDNKTLVIKQAEGGKQTISYGGSGISMRNAEVKAITDFLESQLDIPVVNETGLAGLYDLDLKW